MSEATDESEVPKRMQRYPPAEITAAEFEEFVAGVFDSVAPEMENLSVTIHDQIQGVDGSYDFDATVRFSWAGVDFLVLVEAKRHKNPIKRELIHTLRQKQLSVGAHKAIMFSTSPFQSGALTFAKVHGIALITVTEGRFTIETKAMEAPPVLTREEAKARFGVPTFVGHAYGPAETPDTTRVTLISPERPEYVRELLLEGPFAPDG
jgi:hypothetical protein